VTTQIVSHTDPQSITTTHAIDHAAIEVGSGNLTSSRTVATQTMGEVMGSDWPGKLCCSWLVPTYGG
jgi:hypothetical protein